MEETEMADFDEEIGHSFNASPEWTKLELFVVFPLGLEPVLIQKTEQVGIRASGSLPVKHLTS
jgi:hypothetical protein